MAGNGAHADEARPGRHRADRRVLLLAPTAADGAASRALFASAGIDCALSRDLDHLCAEVGAGAAAVIVPEEVVLADSSEGLACVLREQPVWSDLPVIMLSRGGAESPAVQRALTTLGNVSLIERPVRVSTLLSVVRAALRARERQYQLRDHLDERARAERAVREARDAAEAANRAKDQFLAVLSHELRTPLSPVVMLVSAMEEDPELPPRLREDVATVRRNVALETQLIDDLLDVSRVISGKLRLRTEPVSVHEVLKHTVEVCAPDSLAKKLDVTVDAGAGADVVTGDPARLEQVFWNLLKNAVKFTPEGQRIHIGTRNVGPGTIRVEVRDTGVGIARELLPRLFNAFQQGDPTDARQFGGLGLGLAISKAVLDMHGGTIRAESDGPGKGATFVVELATCAPAAADAPRGAPARAASANGTPLPRLLLVEDHADTAVALSRLLRLEGFHVKTAGSVAAAIQFAADEPFDVVVSDIGLPDGTGYDLMSHIRDRHGIRGIALTGYGMEGDMQRGRDAGFADYLVKPVNVHQLKEVIRRVAAPAATNGGGG